MTIFFNPQEFWNKSCGFSGCTLWLPRSCRQVKLGSRGSDKINTNWQFEFGSARCCKGATTLPACGCRYMKHHEMIWQQWCQWFFNHSLYLLLVLLFFFRNLSSMLPLKCWRLLDSKGFLWFSLEQNHQLDPFTFHCYGLKQRHVTSRRT